jgi:hypothetical protein
MKRRYLGLASMMTLCLLLLIISGCGSSDNKEGGAQVVSVSETSCVTCHSTSVERLTGYPIVANYMASVHNLNSVGCQDCHGAGGQHQGKGPIPYPSPNYQQCQGCHNSAKLVTQYSTSKHLLAATEDGDAVCNRCHTHQGAVLSAISHYTGDGHVMEAQVGAPGAIPNAEPIKCNTCHDTHDAKKLRVDTAWLPSTTVGAATASTNSQYRLCTQCHGYITPLGKLMGSGTAASGTALIGHHETSWYRIIGTTHYDNPTTAAGTSIEGYGMRFTLPDGSVNPNPCFDCHGHESKTNSNNDPASASYNAANANIYTDWAQSGHALGLLTAKFAAAKANPINTALPRTDPVRVAQGLKQVDAVMAAGVPGGAFAGHNTGSCARCHTTEGFSYYFENLANTPVAVATGIIKCYGCHKDPGAGTLRTLKGAKATTNYTTDLGWDPTAAFNANATAYPLAYGKKAYPDVAASNICISCHDSRQNDPGGITDTANTNYKRTHYLQAAATMYVKMGFIAFTDAATLVPGQTYTYRNSLMSNQDVATGTAGAITSTHRILGTPAIVGDSHNPAFFVKGNLDHNGPCVTCHFTGSHSQKIDQRAIDAVCSKCHASEGGQSILKKADFDKYFLEPQSEAYQDALKLAMQVFNDKNTGVELKRESADSEFIRAYKKGTTTEAAAADWTAVMASGAYTNDNATKTKLLGAVSNVVLLGSDPAAYAHARTYSRRLIYDTIDFLDNGKIDSSVGATALVKSAVAGTPVSGLYGKNATKAFADSTLTTLASGTTEAMVYLIKWSRTTGLWDTATERP